MDELYMGYGEADITPDAPMHTIGFGIAEPLAGASHGLCAQVSVWQLGDVRCCLAAIDHIGFALEHSRRLRAALAAELGTRAERVMLCFAHTHSAPNDSIEAAYAAEVDRRILAAGRAALAGMARVRAAWGNAYVDIGVNRRAADAALDRRAGVLKVADSDGRLRLILLRLTAHANCLKADNRQMSPDYFGETRDLISARYGCPVMLTQGASGNVAPRYFRSALDVPDADDWSGRFVRTDAALGDMAREVLRGAGPVIDALEPAGVTALDMHSARCTLYAAVPDMERARAIAAEARGATGADGAAWLAEVARLNAAGVARQAEDIEIQYFTLGGGCLCGVPNELMCEFALRASARLGSDMFYLGGYTNGCTGYFPTEEEYDRGGYEVFWSMLDYFMYHGRVMPLDRDSAAEFMDAVAAGYCG